MRSTASKVERKFKVAKNDPSWSFEGEHSHRLLTHGYHRYPAKFVPQLVGKILDHYFKNSDGVVLDPFAGCGTTLVEAKIRGIPSVGVDVNPVAKLITDAKTHPIHPQALKETIDFVEREVQRYLDGKPYPKTLKVPQHERIDYWFDYKTKRDIALLLKIIKKIDNRNHKVFLRCALSNILKDSSRWLQTSTKPQIDPDKAPHNALRKFLLHLEFMEKRNMEFHNELKSKKHLGTPSSLLLADARNTKLKTGSVSIIITSPPYVTSYEYADIHQLTGYWFDYIEDLRDFRKKFIGSAYVGAKVSGDAELPPSARKAIAELERKDKRVAREVENYFRDMLRVSKEISRVLKKDGLACIVIGNTTLKNIHIPNAEAFAEMLEMVDLRLMETIKRSIPHKLIPTIRDKKTGRFAKKTAQNSKRVYPEEYILIMQR